MLFKLNVWDIQNFLKAVNGCDAPVYLVDAKGRYTNIKGNKNLQKALQNIYRKKYNTQKKMWIDLDIKNPSSYMDFIYRYGGYLS
ncbi:MAG: hypothetical protein ACOYB8_10645 [Eubacteriaceae bacterium]